MANEVKFTGTAAPLPAGYPAGGPDGSTTFPTGVIEAHAAGNAAGLATQARYTGSNAALATLSQGQQEKR